MDILQRRNIKLVLNETRTIRWEKYCWYHFEAEEDLVNSVISVLDSGREKFLFRKYNFNQYGIKE